MSKKAISVTLQPENLLWLRGQARASSRRSDEAALRATGRGVTRGRRHALGMRATWPDGPGATFAARCRSFSDCFRPAYRPVA